MSAQFQNRLVGTVVIVALGVIFLPDLLDGKKQREIEEFTEIPLRPVINEQTSDVIGEGYTPETFEVEEIAKTQDLGGSEEASNKEADSANENNATKAKDTKAKETAPKQVAKTTPVVKKVEPIKAGYTLQLGGFNNAKNVEELVKKLRQNGFTAYTLPAKPIDGSLTKVFVGPELSADKLKTYQAKIKKLNGLQGKIVQYNPLEN
ncbi:SPOR domain-containing protein [Shewanella olleyana]|uniref:SPOR domain-containing protein n=1 Tax=Shewanella olleyana TaxID=135626 RepID=UPI00200FDA5D|nr:SPOR domain-containing protein [Shewanella olleyana]MCL1065234.1 SPOR domain-containing protein [Shewanella olleyana]